MTVTSDSQSEPTVGAASADAASEPLELTSHQQTVARRMAESRATVPDFVASVEVGMEAVAAARAALPTEAGKHQPTDGDFVVKACAVALREHPRLNGAYRDGRFQLHRRINVGLAVAAEDTLHVPVVTDADRKDLTEIAAETAVLAGKARAGALVAAEQSGATFTIADLGESGVDAFTAVVTPTQAAILAVGATRERPVARDGVVLARRTAILTLSCDHRIVYPAAAAAFLTRLRTLLEQPDALA